MGDEVTYRVVSVVVTAECGGGSEYCGDYRRWWW